MRERRVLWLLLGLQLARGLLYALLIPLWQNPDEHAHYEYVKLAAERGRIRLDLPLGGTTAYQVLRALGPAESPGGAGPAHSELRHAIAVSLERHRFWEIRPAVDRADAFTYPELDQPPLYYLGAAQLLRGIGLGSVDREAYALRVLNVLLTLGVIGIAYRVSRELFPDRPLLAVAPAAFITLLPQHTALAGSISNDKLVDLAAAAIFLLLVRSVRQGLSWRGWTAVAGLALTGLLTKATAVFFGPILLSFWDIRRAARRGRTWSRYVVTRLGVVVALAALFVTTPRWLPPLPRSLSEPLLYRAQWLPLNLTLLRRWLAVLFSGFWGNFGHMEAPLPLPLYGVLAVACGAAAAGLALLALDARRRLGPPPWGREVLLFFGVAVFWAVLLTFARDALVNSFSQGRHLFPVLIPIAVLFVVGLRRVVPGIDDRRFVWGLVLALALFDALGIVESLIPFFYGVALLGML